MSKYVKYFNFNKYDKNLPDCAIRAIVGGIGMDYDLVCKKFGMSFKRGRGLIRDSGIDLEDIKTKFEEYFDVIEDYRENFNFRPDPDELDNEEFDPDLFDLNNDISHDSSDDTLADFISDKSNTGSYLVSLIGNPNASNPIAQDPNSGHIVWVKCRLGTNYAIDTFDSSEMLVDCFMRIKKTVPKNSPEHYNVEDYRKRQKKTVNEDVNHQHEKVKRLKKDMRQGIVAFNYKKKSTGKIRKANGTLSKSIIPKEIQAEPGHVAKRKTPADSVVYYDTDVGEIRSFKDYLLLKIKGFKKQDTEEKPEEKPEEKEKTKDKEKSNEKKS